MSSKHQKDQEGSWTAVKHFVIIFLPLLALVGGIVTALFYTERKAERVVLEAHDVYDINLHKKILINDIKSVVSDLKILSELHEIEKMFEDVDGDHKSELMNLSYAFHSFAERTGHYDQIRLLDKTGMEVVRVNFNNGTPYVVPKDRLQHKGHRYYFQKTLELERGNVYISPFDLNMERNEIERPLKPMIRFGTPVLDAHGRKRGIVVLNYLGDTLLQELNNPYAGFQHQTMFINSDGFWLKGLRPEDEWGFMYEDRKGRTLGNAFPEAWQRISNEESGQFYNKDGLFTFTTVYPLMEAQGSSDAHISPPHPEAEAYFWKVANYVSSDALKAGAHKLSVKYTLVFAVLAVILGGVSWIVSNARIRRKLAEQELQLFQNLINQSNDAIYVLEPETSLFKYVNDKACSDLGYTHEELLNMGVADIDPMVKSDSSFWKKHVIEIQKKGYIILESNHRRKDGTEFPVEINVKYTTEEQKGYMIAMVRDITERKRAEEDIRYLNEFLETILGGLEVYVRVVDPKLNVEYENPPLKKRFGDGIGRPCYLIWQYNSPCENCISERAILTQKVQRKEEFSPEGLIFSVTSVPLKTSDDRWVAVEIIYDITRLKQSEYEIRSLASRILSVQEDERKRISRELHDETGQALTAIKLNLKIIEDNFSKDAQNTRKTILSTKELLSQIMKDIKKLAYDLRPATIDDLGLIPAMKSYAGEFAERTDIKVDLQAKIDSQRFPQEIEITLYRILQEALTNVAKHSKAKNVLIELFVRNTKLTMKVTDDGCGFEVDKTLMKSKLNEGTLGLIGIRERVTSLSGELEIASALDKGTKLTVRLPLSRWHKHS